MNNIQNKNYFAYTVCLLVTIIFSLDYLVAKEILNNEVSLYSLSGWRGFCGGSVLLFFFRKKIKFNLIRKNLLSLFFISFFGFFLNQILFMYGLKMTSALSTSIISNTIPLFSLLLAWLLKLEELSIRKVGGILISLTSVTFLLFYKSEGVINLNLGNLLILFNVISFCLAFALGKKVLDREFPYELMTGVMLLFGGTLMLLRGGDQSFDLIIYSQLGTLNICYVLFEILISTSFVYLMNLWTLKQLHLSQVTYFIYFQPIITAVGLIVFKQEYPPLISLPIYLGILWGGGLVLRNAND